MIIASIWFIKITNQKTWFCSVAVITPDSDHISVFRQPRFDSGQDLFLSLSQLQFCKPILFLQFIMFVGIPAREMGRCFGRC